MSGFNFPGNGGRVQGSFGLAGTISPSQITSDQNDWNPSGLSTAAVIRIDTDAARKITGLQGGVDGRVVVFDYIGNTKLTLPKDDGATSTAANRFDFPADISLTPKTSLTIKYDGTASRWKAVARPVAGRVPVWVPAAAMKPRTSNGCAALATVETSTNKVNLNTLDFDASADEYATFSLPAPKGWDKGTITAKFCWKHASTTTNFGVRWGIQGLALTDDEAADTAFGTGQTVDDTGGTTNDIYWTAETGALTIGSSPVTGDLLIFQVYRVGSNSGQDTLAIDAGLIGVWLYFNFTAPTED